MFNERAGMVSRAEAVDDLVRTSAQPALPARRTTSMTIHSAGMPSPQWVSNNIQASDDDKRVNQRALVAAGLNVSRSVLAEQYTEEKRKPFNAAAA